MKDIVRHPTLPHAWILETGKVVCSFPAIRRAKDRNAWIVGKASGRKLRSFSDVKYNGSSYMALLAAMTYISASDPVPEKPCKPKPTFKFTYRGQPTPPEFVGKAHVDGYSLYLVCNGTSTFMGRSKTLELSEHRYAKAINVLNLLKSLKRPSEAQVSQ